jgi:hypothetical protein
LFLSQLLNLLKITATNKLHELLLLLFQNKPKNGHGQNDGIQLVIVLAPLFFPLLFSVHCHII